MDTRTLASTFSPNPLHQLTVARFASARRRGLALREYPGEVPGDLKSAYRYQDLAIKNWPDTVAGWKVARIPQRWQQQYPAERLMGPIFSGNVYQATHHAPTICPVITDGFSAVEAEVIIRIASDTPPYKIKWSLHEALKFIRSIHIGVEIASSPLPTLVDLGPGSVISDFGNNWGVVIGNRISYWPSIKAVGAETFVDQQLVGNGVTLMQDGPLAALLFALGNCAERGYPLRAGQIISTGMISGGHHIYPGQESLHLFAGYGEVRCQIVGAGNI